MKRRILPRAARDIAEIEAHIHGESPEMAANVASRIRRAFDLITDRPDIGRPTLIPRLREWSIPGLPYVIPYRVRGDMVEILRVFHTSRQRPPRWIG
jgi:plasmid stabilization system protein ParE